VSAATDTHETEGADTNRLRNRFIDAPSASGLSWCREFSISLPAFHGSTTPQMILICSPDLWIGSRCVARKTKKAETNRRVVRYSQQPEHIGSPLDGIVVSEDVGEKCAVAGAVVGKPTAQTADVTPLNCVFRDDAHGIYLYQGNCLTILDAIYARHGDDGCFDMIFADPPYFLSNGGITCHAGKMVKVDKGDWDKSKGPELNYEFNREWLKRCQRVLKPNGTIWVTGTHHVIFSVGYAMQQLGFKILNDITWEKPNPPPNLSCRYFTHSTETLIWAAKTEKTKHFFNYAAIKAMAGGKQMKTVWRIPAPGKAEKLFGKHPTQKPVALVERCLLAATREGDLVLDPFMGAGTTAVACLRQGRKFVGIELDFRYLWIAGCRLDTGLLRVRIEIKIENDLDPKAGPMDRISEMADVPEIQAERIFHETKFVFLSCAEARAGSVVHTTVDADVHSAWTHTPQSVRLQTTHIVRCETEILRVNRREA
jgi:site-specific DNA-methyltransferase (adenine-specific)